MPPGAFVKDRKVAVRYARALLEALPDAAAVDAAAEFLTALATGIDQSDELRDVLLNPAVPRALRTRVLESLADGQNAPEDVKSFLVVLADAGRLPAIRSIATVFREEKDAQRGIVPATVTSASPLTPELQHRTEQTLERLCGKKIRLQVRVDPGLIGGMVTQVGSMVYDGSVKSQLARLRRRMAEE